MKRVKVYVEGATRGKGSQPTINIEFRRAFHKFAEKLNLKYLPEFVPCAGRTQAWEIAYEKFLTHDEGEIVMLLVDSEEPSKYPATEAWQHLRDREHDKWTDLKASNKRYVFMMAVTMEAWLLADPEGLARYCGQGFKPGKIPAWPDIEAVSKDDINDTLEAVTVGSEKPYEKGKRSFEALGAINPKTVAEKCPHAAQFIKRLAADCNAG